MGWYSEHLLPKLLNRAMDTQEIRRIRARVTAGLVGEVIELGFGTGHNLAYFPATVTRLLAVEPSVSSIALATGRISAAAIPVDVIGPDAQRLSLPDSSVDFALCIWSLCTIADPVAAVREVRRVLRPGGQLHFVEHGLAPDERVRRWQGRLNPMQRRFMGGCHLDRDIPELLRLGGMTITHLERYYGHDELKVFAAMYEGVAIGARASR